MQNYKLTIEYDGTNYLGFQVQAKGKTIQGEIEHALERLFREKIRIISSGRTDRGVHARGHVINFKVSTDLKNRNIRAALNTYLPRDIVIKKIEKVASDFHAQYSVKDKTYEYVIVLASIRSPLLQRYAYCCNYDFNVKAMRKALKHVVGKHDFRAFASKIPSDKNTERTIKKATLNFNGARLAIRLTADGFLYNMVRNIMGTLCLVGQGKLTSDDFRNILRSKDRTKAAPPAPPEGLTLLSVHY
ncbi:MAG: tRNA pseudouridine(38-40) synthase TruA [Candidatus Omnitrophica bacterium]|nr:tRNA pseudouridine(38-40) synthase TruA [Candidatus Omnitrophota bacterium]